MTTALFTHEACLEHDPGPAHPESPQRLVRIMAALDDAAFARLDRHEAPEASIDHLLLAHRPDYVSALLELDPAPGERMALDPDTAVSAGSLEAARRAAGGAVAAIDAVMGGQAGNAFVAARPPGHHAERGRAMGFCLFNSAAIAALHAQAQWGLARVAVLDFDVHHGNGTQDIAWDRPGVFYASSHQSPCYPGTGSARETGASGNVRNAPLPPGSGSAAFRAAWRDTLLPAVAAFRPELLVLSAGFDAHRADPLAQLQLDTADFGWITGAALDCAAACCGGRLVSVLEGGYDLDALAESCALHVATLLRD
jgi:acetoin utilization deacetylase AcuC-like enzyme